MAAHVACGPRFQPRGDPQWRGRWRHRGRLAPGHGKSFCPNPTGGITRQATRTERISFNESLSALRRDPTLRCAERDTERYGRLGIADLFERAGRTRKVANLTGLTQLDYNLDFIIKSNAGPEPRFLVVPIGHDRTIGGGVKLTGSNRIPRRSSSPCAPGAGTHDPGPGNGLAGCRSPPPTRIA